MSNVLRPQEFPLGAEVDSSPAKVPERTILQGRAVTLAPLDPEAHLESLYESTHGPGNEWLWTYMADGPFAGRHSFDLALRQKAASDDPFYFAILDNASSTAVGYASYLRIKPAHKVIEVGNIVYTAALQRTLGATEAMYLLARHAFEDLGYRRYEWKCDSLNQRSRRAALRLGFTFEGTFRQHMIIKGRNRDTSWYSMLDVDWAARRARFEEWLAPSNFDADGRQKTSLSQLNSTDR